MPVTIRPQEEVEEIISKEVIIEVEVPKGVEKLDFNDKDNASWIIWKAKETGNSYYKLISPTYDDSFGGGYGTWFEIHVALAGLVCEIYLKYLIYKNLNKNEFCLIKGHDLKTLFGQLNGEQKSKILSFFSELDLTSFEGEVDKIKLVFEDFRYSYELNGYTIHAGFIKKFADALYDIVNENDLER